MIRRLPSLHRLAMAASIVLPAATWAQAPDVDPLSLQVTPATEEAASAKASPWRVALELGGGRIDLRGGGHADGRRASIDVRYSAMLEGGFTFTASNRFDYVDPPLAGQHASSNSLRELFVGWQQPGASFSLDAGRINHRQGPAFGYSPTDYFRRGALRSVSTADPVALRERRMGTVMLRAGQLWANAQGRRRPQARGSVAGPRCHQSQQPGSSEWDMAWRTGLHRSGFGPRRREPVTTSRPQLHRTGYRRPRAVRRVIGRQVEIAA
jgi:hypothetical protein